MDNRFTITIQFTDLGEVKISHKKSQLIVKHEGFSTTLENPENIPENTLFYQFAEAIYDKIGIVSGHLALDVEDLSSELDDDELASIYDNLN